MLILACSHFIFSTKIACEAYIAFGQYCLQEKYWLKKRLKCSDVFKLQYILGIVWPYGKLIFNDTVLIHFYTLQENY